MPTSRRPPAARRSTARLRRSTIPGPNARPGEFLLYAARNNAQFSGRPGTGTTRAHLETKESGRALARRRDGHDRAECGSHPPANGRSDLHRHCLRTSWPSRASPDMPLPRISSFDERPFDSFAADVTASPNGVNVRNARWRAAMCAHNSKARWDWSTGRPATGQPALRQRAIANAKPRRSAGAHASIRRISPLAVPRPPRRRLSGTVGESGGRAEIAP